MVTATVNTDGQMYRFPQTAAYVSQLKYYVTTCGKIDPYIV